MIDKKRSGPDIWTKTPNQSIDTEKIIFTIWYKKS